MAFGYDVLHGGAGWLDLSSRGIFIARGDDRARWLHALSTNHIEQLAPGSGCYTFFLNAQGKIQADAYVLCFAAHLMLDTEPESREKLFAHLSRYIIADDVALEDATGTMSVTALEGPEAAAVLERAGAPVPADDYAHTEWNGATIARISFTGAPGFRIYGGDDIPARLGVSHIDGESARVVRIENQRPRYGEDILDTTLVQESRQMHAVHLQKGCYLGQEIVERIRSRGHVNRLLAGLDIDAAEPPAAGAKLLAGGQEVGQITSAAVSPDSGRAVALAYVRAEHTVPGTVLAVEGGYGAVVRQ